MNRIIGIVLLLIGTTFSALGQDKGIAYKIVGKDLYCSIDRSLPQSQIDSLLGTCDIDFNNLEAMLRSGESSADHWQVEAIEPHRIVLKKPLKSLTGKAGNQKDLIVLLNEEIESTVEDYRFGYNMFHKPAVIELDNGLTRFFLKVEGGKPHGIFISGTFNEWSTSANPMEPCDSGYYVDLKLGVGPHYYKYIVNGYWLLDPRNQLKESDWEGNENSVYFKCNYTFRLKGYTNANRVNLAGSFNDWNDNRFTLRRVPGGWQRKCYVKEGTHAYKYVVDGEWILDPDNPVKRDDGAGNQNSFMSVGDSIVFYYPRDLDARFVVLSGSFNGWNAEELRMQKTDSGWVLPYVLAAGNYEYRFRVADKMEWQMDPLNPISSGPYETKNSVVSVKANHHFFFPRTRGVDEVILTGDFNGWNEHGYYMERRADGWHADLYLPKGKTRYKFIVDGKWIKDPSNPLFEPNEYDGYNSVIWMK